MSRLFFALPLVLLPLSLPLASRAHAQSGRIAGQVVDRGTGHPVMSVQVFITGGTIGTSTDLDGRYRLPPLPAGTHSVTFRRLGFQLARFDRVRVIADSVTTLNVAMDPAVTSLTAVEVKGSSVERMSAEAGLLALQKAAPSVSDGISAEAIKRSPDADAADAVTRIAGISVVDSKFVVVRGLPERYSNTLLNGVELPSPEPTKKLVPLDIFPASLIDAIVVTKAATPDRPGDFAGGSVEVRTKEFPERFVAELSFSQGYNSRSTFQRVPVLARGMSDYFAKPPDRFTHLGISQNIVSSPTGPRMTERFAESVRSVWQPAELSGPLHAGFGATLGGQIALGPNPLGVVFSLTQSLKTEYTPDRLLLWLVEAEEPRRGYVYRQTQTSADLGALLNVSYRLGAATKLGLKNLYTRNAEETFVRSDGFETERGDDSPIRQYQVRYVERRFLQNQLAGEHVIRPLFGSRIEWKATRATAWRDEPDHRTVRYTLPAGRSEYVVNPSNPNPDMWIRYLTDELRSGQLDVTVPVGLRHTADASVKVGALYRSKARTFDVTYFRFELSRLSDIETLSPEQIFSPEYLGSHVYLRPFTGLADSYSADEGIGAAYAMIDVPLLERLRLVGGARMEDWTLELRRSASDTATALLAPPKAARDLLWSANLTYALSDRMNFRLAGFRSVTRPDPREVSPDFYLDLVGGCYSVGYPELERAKVLNADARWELYPAAGQVISVSAFYKEFEKPIVEIVGLALNSCRTQPRNAKSARNVGAELEARHALDMLPGPLSHLTASLNVTVVQSRVDLSGIGGHYAPGTPLTGQSPFVLNTGLTYASSGGRLGASALYNYFADRVARYGIAEPDPLPNLIEEGRGTLDAKVQTRVMRGTTIALSARNLTDAASRFTFEFPTSGTATSEYVRRGISLSLSLSHAF